MTDGAKCNADQFDQSSDSFLVMNDYQVDILFFYTNDETKLTWHQKSSLFAD